MARERLLLFLIISFFVSILTPARAEGDKKADSITFRLSADSVYAGGRVQCVFMVRSLKGQHAEILIDSSAIKPFVFIGSKRFSGSFFQGVSQERLELELAAFGSGQQTIPPLPVMFRDNAGNVTGRIDQTPPVRVFIKSMTDSSMHQLRPIKPLAAPDFPYFLFVPLLFFVLSGAAVVLLFLYLVRRKVHKSAESVDPGQVAHRKLSKLTTRLSAGMTPSACHDELSAIMREYLERRFNIRALEAVTQEIERDLKKLEVAGRESIINLLRQADLVKFADSRPDLEESRQSIHKAEQLIRSVRHTKR
ncbi:hypothetical protein [Chlorobium phaeobacteroides]|jgi:hypothetical protein|uniref:Protein BatD n=1 Tax=Chlorobium phaeobacteroides (strain DSM 266 / SMG 266 / 2430) TaxID=290317 RepID=A1BJ64_CHLPD|nr:hypothetical protein [Chlorobium phaeobacteroides]ABL66441.1 conserved hypothetical protein [Chlorobium phaeobacteroides DSM 266]MBV5319531.1 hypothetical protein [Chlorobium phaeobacteroides]